MSDEKKSESTLSQQLDDFKKQNPKVAEAMKLFGMTLTKYQGPPTATAPTSPVTPPAPTPNRQARRQVARKKR